MKELLSSFADPLRIGRREVNHNHEGLPPDLVGDRPGLRAHGPKCPKFKRILFNLK